MYELREVILFFVVLGFGLMGAVMFAGQSAPNKSTVHYIGFGLTIFSIIILVSLKIIFID